MGDEVDQKSKNIHDLSKESEKHKSNNRAEQVSKYKAAYENAKKLNNDKLERDSAFNLGIALLQNKEPKNGLHYLCKAKTPLGDDCCHGDLCYYMGCCYQQMNEKTNALHHFKEAFKEFNTCEKHIHELKICCLHECIELYQQQKDYKNAAETYKLMRDAYSRDEYLKRAKCLCDSANCLIKVKQDTDTDTKIEIKNLAVECMSLLSFDSLPLEHFDEAATCLNEFGLMLTQILDYDNAHKCFSNAEKLLTENQNLHLLAVVKQNLGAALNFKQDFKNAVKIHQEAIQLYGKFGETNNQGQCFMNLALAQNGLGTVEGTYQATIAYHHALQAAKDSNDKNLIYQCLEGLGDISYNQGHFDRAEKYFKEALQNVGDQELASERIWQKAKFTFVSPYNKISTKKMFAVSNQLLLKNMTKTDSRNTANFGQMVAKVMTNKQTLTPNVSFLPVIPKQVNISEKEVEVYTLTSVPGEQSEMRATKSVAIDDNKQVNGKKQSKNEDDSTPQQYDESDADSYDYSEDDDDDGDDDDDENENMSEEDSVEEKTPVFNGLVLQKKQMQRPTLTETTNANFKQYEDVLRKQSEREEAVIPQLLETPLDIDDTDEEDTSEDSSEEEWPASSGLVDHQKQVQSDPNTNDSPKSKMDEVSESEGDSLDSDEPDDKQPQNSFVNRPKSSDSARLDVNHDQEIHLQSGSGLQRQPQKKASQSPEKPDSQSGTVQNKTKMCSVM